MPMTIDDLDEAREAVLALFDQHGQLMTLPQFEHFAWQVKGGIQERLDAVNDKNKPTCICGDPDPDHNPNCDAKRAYLAGDFEALK